MEKVYDHPDRFAIQGVEPRYDKDDANSSARSFKGAKGSRLYDPETSTASAFSLYETQLNHARSVEPPDNKEVVCGPLLNYRYMDGDRWHGSVLIVTKREGGIPRSAPTLLLRRSIFDTDSGNHPSRADPDTRIKGFLLYSDLRMNFWRFDICLGMGSTESRWEYTITEVFFLHRLRCLTHSFVIPSYNESMRIMFYSCNGWCDGAEAGEWNHLSLWKNVLSRHAETAFHVMIGGGDQIYSDGIYTAGPLLEWTKIPNPQERLQYQCTEKLQQECDAWYLDNYMSWYGREPFASALCQIPSINIWDDHDIIDGFGSYANETMECSVFQAIGALAHKYYMLFQHHLPPGKVDYNIQNTYIADPIPEPQYVFGPRPGPYIRAHSHNIFTRLGARIAFLGVDARTERTREQTNYRETYDYLFARVDAELDTATRSGRPIKHLVLLFGIPLAYPPLTWIENIFEGSAGRSFQQLHHTLGIGKNAINPFDNAIELLDDLNDHYTSNAHQNERRYLIERIQRVCAAHSVRATILSGDVHLAAVGRFFTTHKGDIPPIEEDFRFINNIISSAIVNQPPPDTMAKLIARSDRIRHLNAETEECLFKLFRSDSTTSAKKPEGTTVAMPRRNFSIITENSPNSQGRDEGLSKLSWRQFFAKHGNRPLHFGEANAGTKHIAASDKHGKGNDGSLDVCICVEVDHQHHDGQTAGYGFTIPALEYRGPAVSEPVWPEKTS